MTNHEEETGFRQYDRVIFRESETGPPEPGEITLVHDPDKLHPRGGEYEVDLDDGTNVLAWVHELEHEKEELEE